MIDPRRLEEEIKAFNDWVDANRAREFLTWRRAVDSAVAADGVDAVVQELYDTASAALDSIVHLRGTADGLLDGLAAHVRSVNDRAGAHEDDGDCNCSLQTGFVHWPAPPGGHYRGCPLYRRATPASILDA